MFIAFLSLPFFIEERQSKRKKEIILWEAKQIIGNKLETK